MEYRRGILMRPLERRRLAVVVLVATLMLVAVPAAQANPAGDLWGWGTGLFGEAARGVAGDGIRALTSWVADGAGWLAERCFEAMSATSDPRPQEGWFSDAYRRMALIGMAMSAPCLVLGISQALLHQDGRLLGRAIAAAPGSVLLTFAAVAVARMLLGATDEISLWLVETSGRDVGGFGAKMALLLASSPQTSAFVVFLVAFVCAISALVLWIELLVRAALVYVLLGFFPLMSAMMIWPAAAGGIRRLVRLLVSVILSKVVIVAVISMGVAAASDSGSSDKFEGLLVGTAMVAVACFSPMAIHRLLPLLEESVHVRGNLSAGGAARTATSSASTMRSAHSATQQLGWMRARQPGSGGGASAATPRPPSGGAMTLAGGSK
jgi:hypothetical protein